MKTCCLESKGIFSQKFNDVNSLTYGVNTYLSKRPVIITCIVVV